MRVWLRRVLGNLFRYCLPLCMLERCEDQGMRSGGVSADTGDDEDACLHAGHPAARCRGSAALMHRLALNRCRAVQLVPSAAAALSAVVASETAAGGGSTEAGDQEEQFSFVTLIPQVG